MKKLHHILSLLKLDINHSLENGISFLGINIKTSKASIKYYGSQKALEYCLKLDKHAYVLDVGSGAGQHAIAFHQHGSHVTCIDFGTSIYAKNSNKNNRINVINIDFIDFIPTQKYDLVWAAHVLEHQTNVGLFLKHLQKCCSNDGHIAISVPTPHRRLWGGHLTMWTPGLLAYNLVISGLDCSDAKLIYGYREFSLIIKNRPIEPPEITYDSGDLDLVSKYMPNGLRENSDPWF